MVGLFKCLVVKSFPSPFNPGKPVKICPMNQPACFRV